MYGKVLSTFSLRVRIPMAATSGASRKTHPNENPICHT